MNYFFLLIALIITLEIYKLFKLNVKLNEYIYLCYKAKILLKLKKASDQWKKIFIIRLMKRLSISFFVLVSLFALTLSPFLIIFTVSILYKLELINFFYNFWFYLISIIISIIYLKLRNLFYER